MDGKGKKKTVFYFYFYVDHSIKMKGRTKTVELCSKNTRLMSFIERSFSSCEYIFLMISIRLPVAIHASGKLVFSTISFEMLRKGTEQERTNETKVRNSKDSQPPSFYLFFSSLFDFFFSILHPSSSVI